MTLTSRHRPRQHDPSAAWTLRRLQRAPALGALAGALLPALCGCAARLQPPPCTRPDLGDCAIEEVTFQGDQAVGSGDLAERIATAESSHLLGGVLEHVPLLSVWDSLTVDYERFDRFVLERDLARIERFYRANGFYDAHVRAARVERIGGPGASGRVRVHIVITEGEPVKIGAVELAWKDWRLDKAKEIANPITNVKNRLKLGARFDETRYEDTKKALLRVATDRGFAYASVEGHVDVDLVKHEARIRYTIELGPESVFGPIKLEGLGELPEAPLRAALGIEEGEPYSTEALEDAERALASFGVFGAIDVKTDRSPPGQPPNPVVPVTFVLQPAALRAVKLGGGAEIGARVEAHLVAGWEDRNFLGGLRRFSVEARPGLVFYPTTFATLNERPTNILPEIQLRSELRQPAAIERRTTAVLRGAFKHYRLLPTTEEPATEAPGKESIVGYNEAAGSLGLERPFLKTDLNASLLYNVQVSYPFAYNPVPLPSGYTRVFIPYLQAAVSYDLRRNRAGKPERLNPRQGIYAAANAQLAGYLVPGADTKDVRLQPEFRAYVPVSRRTTLGFRLLTGFLFPQNYGKTFSGRDLQLLQFRGFFSGGASSNRGYGYNEVGPHDYVPLFAGGQPVLAPTGGLSLWESSLELRIPLTANLGTTLFLDGSDVTRKSMFFRLSRPHLSAGFGLRYQTPVGPLRADIGYRIPCAQVIGVCPAKDLPSDEGQPTTVLGLPIAVSIAIGEAF